MSDRKQKFCTLEYVRTKLAEGQEDPVNDLNRRMSERKSKRKYQRTAKPAMCFVNLVYLVR